MSSKNNSYSRSDNKSKSLTSKSTANTSAVLKVADVDIQQIVGLLGKYQLTLELVNDNQSISGSYWGDSEAGLIDNTIYARKDTPIHSLFHEMCHYICMDEKRRKKLDTNAEGDFDEENGVCYLQILLANELSNNSSERMMQDMDTWGYTFRLGSAQAWFEDDAEDALAWLQDKKLLDIKNQPNYSLRFE